MEEFLPVYLDPGKEKSKANLKSPFSSMLFGSELFLCLEESLPVMLETKNEPQG
jgi:hypothetical protein